MRPPEGIVVKGERCFKIPHRQERVHGPPHCLRRVYDSHHRADQNRVSGRRKHVRLNSQNDKKERDKKRQDTFFPCRRSEYSEWINGESNRYFKSKKSILLVTDVSDDYRKNRGTEFTPLLWAEFCIRLRRLLAVSAFFSEKGLVTSALIIAFIGAVEQNLLDFVLPDADLGRSLRYASTADHIKQALMKQPMEVTRE
jgi:hypothetical protein